MGGEDQKSHNQQREKSQRSEIGGGRMSQDKTAQPFAEFGTAGKAGFQLAKARVNQVEAHMRFRALVQVAFSVFLCFLFRSRVFSLHHIFGKSHRSPCDFQFVCAGAFTDSLNHVAIAIARRKLHLRVSAGRIRAQQRFDEADAFEEVAPIERRQQAHAGDDVADGNLRRGLALVFGMDDLFNAGGLPGKLLLQPFNHRHQRRILLTKTLRKLNYE